MDKERKSRDIHGLLGKKTPLPTKADVTNAVAIVTGKEADDKLLPPQADYMPPVARSVPSTGELSAYHTGMPPAPQNVATQAYKHERGRPKKEHGRVKFTTILSPDKRDQLKIIAIKQGRNVADILDELIDAFLDKNP